MTCDDTPPFPPSTKQPRGCWRSPTLMDGTYLLCGLDPGHEDPCGLNPLHRPYHNPGQHYWNADGWVTDDEPMLSDLRGIAPDATGDEQSEDFVRRKRDESTADPINPPHYTDGEVECIDAIRSILGKERFKDYCTGTAIKYLWRAGRKDGEPHERCMAKADWYMSWLAGRDPRKQ